MINSTFNNVSLAAVQMRGISGELSRFGQDMKGNLFAAWIIKAQEPCFLPDPNLTANVFGRRRVIGAFELNVTVAMDGSASFLEYRKQTRRQRLQGSSFDLFKKFGDLSACGAVDARVRYGAFPIGKEKILRREALEAPAFDSIVLREFNPGFHLAFVPRHRRLGRKNHRAIKPGKLL